MELDLISCSWNIERLMKSMSLLASRVLENLISYSMEWKLMIPNVFGISMPLISHTQGNG